MKPLIIFIAIETLFLLSINVNAQIDFEKYKPLPLPQYAPVLDSTLRSNGLLIFHSETGEFISKSEAPQPTSLNHLPPSDFARATQETMVESRLFNNLVPADQIGILTDYPIRTVVKLYVTMYNPSNGQSSNVTCSGIMVGDNEVMTAGHCVSAGGSDPTYASAITVVPAYNMGSSPFGSTEMTQWLSFTQWTNNGNWDYDIAMVKLAQPIGNTVGWLGFGYSMNNAFFTSQSNTFHSFGYPAQNDAGQTVFEGGERMYYMNGVMDYFESANSMCHYNIGFHGQSGSGLYFNNNGDRYVYGVLSHGSNQVPNTCHTRIDDWMFGHFLDYIDVVSVEETESDGTLSIFPNPSETGIFNLGFSNEFSKQITITNSTGQIITSLESFEQSSIEVDLSTAPSGIYYCTVTMRDEVFTTKLVKM